VPVVMVGRRDRRDGGRAEDRSLGRGGQGDDGRLAVHDIAARHLRPLAVRVGRVEHDGVGGLVLVRERQLEREGSGAGVDGDGDGGAGVERVGQGRRGGVGDGAGEGDLVRRRQVDTAPRSARRSRRWLVVHCEVRGAELSLPDSSATTTSSYSASAVGESRALNASRRSRGRPARRSGRRAALTACRSRCRRRDSGPELDPRPRRGADVDHGADGVDEDRLGGSAGEVAASSWREPGAGTRGRRRYRRPCGRRSGRWGRRRRSRWLPRRLHWRVSIALPSLTLTLKSTEDPRSRRRRGLGRRSHRQPGLTRSTAKVTELEPT
jgi:hypothetical protein